MKKILLILVVCVCAIQLGITRSVEDPFEGWRYVETEHLTIIFEDRDSEYAHHVASFGDDVFKEIADMLNHWPKSKVPVVITGRTAWANGYFSPFPPKIILFTTSPSDRFLGSRTKDWLYALFTHELVHYIHLTAPVGPSKYLSPIFGPDLPGVMNTIFMPGWWVEGIATFSESTISEGGRGDSPSFAMVYEAPIYEQNMWSLGQSGYASSFPPRNRIYASGYFMIDYLARTYGIELFAQINEEFAKYPFLGLPSAIPLIAPTTAPLWFTEAIKEIASNIPDIPRLGESFSPPGLGNYYLPASTPYGVIGFSHTQSDGGAIRHYVTNKDQGELIRRLPIRDYKSLSFSEDGKQAIFSFTWEDSSHPASLSMASQGYADLYTIDLEDLTIKRITTKQQLLQPQITSNGSKIIAIEPRGPLFRLVEVDPETHKVLPIYEVSNGSIYEPQFSPDGKNIIAIQIVDGRSSLIMIDNQKNVHSIIEEGDAELHNPRFFDENTIVFASDFDGRLALYMVDIHDHSIVHVLSDPVGILGAVPIDDMLVFQIYTSEGYALRSIPLADLTFKTVNPTPSVQIHQSGTTVAEYLESKVYYDFPKFVLWLPFPAIDNGNFSLGAISLFNSVLGRHALQLQVAYNFSQQLPLASVQYQFNPKKYSLTVEGVLNNLYSGGREHILSTTIGVPLYSERGIDSSQNMSLSSSLSTYIRETVTLGSFSAQLGYQKGSYATAKDYFGSSFGRAAAGIQFVTPFTDMSNRIVAFGNVVGQLAIGKTHHVAQAEIQAVAKVRDDLAFLNPLDDVRFTVKGGYRIPLGLFDIPLYPYGGIVGMGIELDAVTSFALNNNQFDWKRDLTFGVEFSSDILIGSIAQMRPFVRLTVDVIQKNVTPSLGIYSQSLFGLKELFVPAL